MKKLLKCASFFLEVLIIILLVPAAVFAADDLPKEQRKSGFDTMGSDTQAMQRNDSENPAILWVREGERLWHEKTSEDAQSCASCHGNALDTMKGVAAQYPKYDSTTQKPIDLSGKIQQCRQERQKAAPFASESRQLLGITAYIGMQSRGVQIEESNDPRLAQNLAAGKMLFTQRIGQLNLSCAACHTDNWGKKLGGSVIPQGHANGYPLYRLEWQNVGSLQRRIRNCMTGVRAEPMAYGDPALIDLEIYLKKRAAGLNVEIPAVRP
jgi:L-cysteine S-thiosulfotransferase